MNDDSDAADLLALADEELEVADPPQPLGQSNEPSQ